MLSLKWRGPSGLAKLALLASLALVAACADPYRTASQQSLESRAAAASELAQTSGDDARSVVRRGLIADPEIRTQASLISASSDQIRIARAEKFPSLTSSASAGTGSAGAGDPAIGVTGRQLLWDFGAADRAVDLADVELQSQYQRFQQAVDKSISAGLLAFAEVALRRDVQTIRQAQQASVQSLAGLIDQRVDIGAIPLDDQLEVLGQIERAHYDVFDAEYKLFEAQDRLLRLTGTQKGGKAPDLAGLCLPARKLPDSVVLGRLAVAEATLKFEDAKRSAYPRVAVTAPGQIELGTGGVSSGLNIAVDTTFLRGGAVRARISQAQNQLSSANAALRTAERNARLSDVALDNRLAVQRQKLKMLARQIELQDRTRALYRSQYVELGRREITDLLDAERTLADRKIELAETRYHLLEAEVECAIRSGTLRQSLGLTSHRLHGYPLSPEGL